MKTQNEGAIIYVINMMMDKGISVWSSKQIQSMVEKETGQFL